MKSGWQLRKLGDICRFQNGFAFKSDLFTKTGEPIIRISDIQNEEVCEDNLVCFNLNSYKEDLSRFIVYPNDILIAMSGGTTGKLGINRTGRRFYLNQRVGVFREDKNVLDHHYLFYYLHTKSDESLRIAAGAAQPNLSTAQINAFEIPVPPLSEQQRIVNLLDAEFAKIDTLKANAEQNLQNAKDLLSKSIKKTLSGYHQVCLQDLFNIRTGKLNSNEAVIGGQYPFFTCSREVFAIDKYAFDCEAVLLAGNNASGDFNVKYYNGKFNAYQRTYVITAKTPQTNTRILYYVLTDFLSELKKMSLGANTKFLKLGMIENVKVPIVDAQEIISTINRLDALNEKCKTLQANYEKTIALCDDLKQALLRKAFNGEI